MTRFIVVAIMALVACYQASAAHTQVAETHLTTHNNEQMPRFAKALPNVLIVKPGQTFTLPPDSTFDAIEVAGTLRVSREYDTICRFTHLQILPGGIFDCGTADEPVVRNVELIVRDVPLRTDIDPHQWGNGIINFGTWTIHGRMLDRTWAIIEEVDAGATTLILVEPPSGTDERIAYGWRVGDRLLIPDTRQMRVNVAYRRPDLDLLPRREAEVSIAAIDGAQITLSKPLDFEHLAARAPDGTVRYKPYVANATRNIIIRSENPTGTRGHTVTTDMGFQSLCYAEFRDLGRTLPVPLDDTRTVDGQLVIGTNQVGRYPIHWHHNHSHGPDFGSAIGNYVDGGDISKWGIIVHGTNDTHVADNVVNRCVGSGIITEDGPEIRNVFERNFVMGCKGTDELRGSGAAAKFLFLRNNPGAEGSGFWFHGTRNIVRGNVACNNNIGINAFSFRPHHYNVPILPGIEPTVPYRDPRPIEFDQNACFSNVYVGFEFWNLPESPPLWEASNLDCWHNGAHQAFAGSGERTSIALRGFRALAQGGVTSGLHTSQAYTFSVGISNCRIEGCLVGIFTARVCYVIENSTLQNKLNIKWTWNRPWPGPSRGVAVVNVSATPLVEGEPNIAATFPLPDTIELDGAGYPENAVQPQLAATRTRFIKPVQSHGAHNHPSHATSTSAVQHAPEH